MRPRTILFTVAGLLIAGMLVFLAMEVSGGSSSGAENGDDQAAAKRARNPVAAQRSIPAPRPEQTAEVGDEPAIASGRQDPPAGDAAPARPGRRAPLVAVGPAAGTAGTVSERPTTSNTDPEQDEKMAAATASYDSGDYQAAQEKAMAVLETSPRNVKMLRIAVSTACMFGDMDRARELNARLPKAQQEQMKKRCRKNGGDL